MRPISLRERFRASPRAATRSASTPRLRSAEASSRTEDAAVRSSPPATDRTPPAQCQGTRRERGTSATAPFWRVSTPSALTSPEAVRT